jgi:hypothetical protein
MVWRIAVFRTELDGMDDNYLRNNDPDLVSSTDDKSGEE